MSKRLVGGIIDCKDKKSSPWHSIRFPDGSNWVNSSIMSGRNPPLYCALTLIAMQGHQTKHTMSLDLFKKNLNASRPSEYLPVRGKKMSKRVGGIIGCKLLFLTFNVLVAMPKNHTVTNSARGLPN